MRRREDGITRSVTIFVDVRIPLGQADPTALQDRSLLWRHPSSVLPLPSGAVLLRESGLWPGRRITDGAEIGLNLDTGCLRPA